jgi:Probable cobalt transporter subunit (CbtB)
MVKEEVSMEGSTLGRHISLGKMPLWSWLLTLLLLAMLFVLLSASGDLLVPLLGQAAGIFDYAHEFAHDGRHLLAVPCH